MMDLKQIPHFFQVNTYECRQNVLTNELILDKFS